MKKLILSLVAGGLCALNAADTVVKLPEPNKKGGMPLMEALANRKSSRAFNSKADIQPDILGMNPNLLQSPAKMNLAAIMQARPQMAVVALVYQYVEPNLLQSFKTVIDIREQGSKIPQILRECCQDGDDTADENYDLSERESEVLVLVAQGSSSKEIADKLNISIHTVNTHRKNITRKTGIKSVAGLAVYAMLHNLV